MTAWPSPSATSGSRPGPRSSPRAPGWPGRQARWSICPRCPSPRSSSSTSLPAVEPRSPTEWPSFIHHTERFWYGLATPGVGIKVGGHHEGAEVDPDRRRGTVDPAYAEGLVRYAERWVPGVVPEPRAEATCLYTTTPDTRFLLDRAGPLVIGSPCSGHGFKFVPLIGRILADLTDGIAPDGPFRRLGDPITAGRPPVPCAFVTAFKKLSIFFPMWNEEEYIEPGRSAPPRRPARRCWPWARSATTS